jgi:RNA polymerase sigma-70 factor, ECF subfamily
VESPANALAILVGRAQSGDSAALDRLLRMLQEPLYRHIRLIVGDDHLAEEVLQDALLIVARKLAWLRDPAWLRAWAYRIATREAVRRARRERRWRDALGDDAIEASAIAAVEPPFEPELVAAVPRLLETVSPASAIVLRMHYIEGLSYAEVAEALEISIGTVKSRLSYGLATLRRTVGARVPTA